MSERLPLSERSFQALEEAYEKQWTQARLLHEQQESLRAYDRGGRSLYAADVAADEMQRLWAETRHLHHRYTEISTHTNTHFTVEERERLAFLGFDVSSVHASAAMESSAPTAPATSPKPPQTSTANELQKKEVAALRMENAQLLSSLAWYTFRDKAQQQDSDVAAEHIAPFTSSSPLELFGSFTTLSKTAEELFSVHRPSQQESPPPPPSALSTALDIAIRDLVDSCQFPPLVRVEKMALSHFYRIDRPVVVTFASPQSSTLLVQDPDGVEADCELRAYVEKVYAPLLRALRWRAPAEESSSAGETALRLSSSAGQILQAGSRTTAQIHRTTLYKDTGKRKSSNRADAGSSIGRKTSLNVGDANQEVALQLVGCRPASTPTSSHLDSAYVETRRSPSLSSQAALSQMSYAELVALKRSTIQRLGRTTGEGS